MNSKTSSYDSSSREEGDTSENSWNEGTDKENHSNTHKVNLDIQLFEKDSESDGWDSTPSNNLELLNVKFLIKDKLITMNLTDNMIIQDATDIIGDMLGIIDDRLSLEMNGKILEPYEKLKALAINREIELRVVLYNNIPNFKDITKIKQCQSASVQTKPLKQMVSRITQTPSFPLVDRGTNTAHSKFVQVDHIISPSDKVMIPKKYVAYESYIRAQHEQAVMIQKSIRRFLAQKRILKMKKERDLAILQNQIQKEEITHEILQHELKLILQKHSVPCQDDFSKAFSVLANWLKQEKSKIAEKKGSEKKYAMNELFKKEMDSLNFINRFRMAYRDEKEFMSKSKIVEEASKPQIRKYSKGNKTIIESFNLEIATKFKDMLRNLKQLECSKEERVHFLKKFVNFLLEWNVPECTNEMISLAEKECQMIYLGIKANHLEGCRKRLLELFLHFSMSPEFNPEIERSLKIKEISPLIQCRICRELKPTSDFNVDILRGLTDCTLCSIRRELSQSNLSLVPFKTLHKEVILMEQKLGCQGDYASLLQPPDFYYLFQRIWEGRSCLSEVNDIKLLKFIRWNQEEIWSPWNCLLLTGNEGELHLSITNKQIFYGEHFIKKVQNKHLQAKLKFKNLETLYQKIKTGFEEENDTQSNVNEIECPML